MDKIGCRCRHVLPWTDTAVSTCSSLRLVHTISRPLGLEVETLIHSAKGESTFAAIIEGEVHLFRMKNGVSTEIDQKL